MAALDHHTGRVTTLWGDELTGRSAPPFPLDDTIIVSHNCAAERACFRLLGWPQPRFFDTFVEHRLTDAYADWREEGAVRRRFGNSFKDSVAVHTPNSLYSDFVLL
jgi:hypothetical protein